MLHQGLGYIVMNVSGNSTQNNFTNIHHAKK